MLSCLASANSAAKSWATPSTTLISVRDSKSGGARETACWYLATHVDGDFLVGSILRYFVGVFGHGLGKVLCVSGSIKSGPSAVNTGGFT